MEEVVEEVGAKKVAGVGGTTGICEAVAGKGSGAEDSTTGCGSSMMQLFDVENGGSANKMGENG